MNAIIRFFLFVALIESVHLRAVHFQDARKPIDNGPITRMVKRQANLTDTFVPIANLLNLIAGIQDQLPPIRVKVASFPVSSDSTVAAKSQIVSETVQETTVPSSLQIEASTSASIPITMLTSTFLTPLLTETTTPSVVTSQVIPLSRPVFPLAELKTSASFVPVEVNTLSTQQISNVDKLFAPVAVSTTSVPTLLPQPVLTTETIPVEMSAPVTPSLFVAPSVNVVDVVTQTNTINSPQVLPISTSRLLF